MLQDTVSQERCGVLHAQLKARLEYSRGLRTGRVSSESSQMQETEVAELTDTWKRSSTLLVCREMPGGAWHGAHDVRAGKRRTGTRSVAPRKNWTVRETTWSNLCGLLSSVRPYAAHPLFLV